MLMALFTIHCSLFTSHAVAQRFFNLTAQEVEIDSLLPVFTYAYPVGNHYADSVYSVSIAYPEFITMSEDDVKRYQRISGAPLKAMPDVEQRMTVSRKKGTLYLSFVPLVYRNGEYQKLRDIQALHFHLDINGKTVQEGCTSDMLYRVDELVSYISQFFTLKTGDLLFTGTPVGVGPVHIDDHLEGWLEERKVLEFNCK